MTIETVLTSEKLAEIRISNDEDYAFARAIEQAVLRSDEIQRLREDARRYIFLKIESKPGQPFDLFDHMRIAKKLVEAYDMFCTSWTEWDEVINAAMEKQP